MSHIEEPVEVSRHSDGIELCLRTPGQYALGLAVDILRLLDKQPGVSVTNTGWKEGFGIRVAEWVPIETPNVVAKLMTDGEVIEIRRQSGGLVEFERLLDFVREFLERAGGQVEPSV